MVRRLHAYLVLSTIILSACVAPRVTQVAPLPLTSPLPLQPAASELAPPATALPGVSGDVQLFDAPFAGADVTVYALPDLTPVAPAGHTDAAGHFQLELSQAQSGLLLVLVEKADTQLAGVLIPDRFSLQAADRPVITLAGTLATRLLLPRLLEVLHSRSRSSASQMRATELAQALANVSRTVSMTLAQAPADVRLQATLATVRAMPSGELIRQLAEEVVSLTPAWQAFAKWLEQCHATLIQNMQEGGAAFPLEAWTVGEVWVESPQISLSAEGEVVIHYQGQTHHVASGPEARAEGADMQPRLQRLDQLLGNPPPVATGGGGGGSSHSDPTSVDLTVIDGNLPAPVWEEP